MSCYIDYIQEKLRRADSLSVNDIRFLLRQIEEYGFKHPEFWKRETLHDIVKQLQNILRERGQEDVQ